MSRVRADRLTNRAGTGAPTFPNGAVITGVATATSFAGNATGLTGTPNISVGSITASGTVSVGGTLTYEDVSNVDSVGLITARTGVNIVAGGLDVKGLLQEKVKITAGKLSDNSSLNVDNGMIQIGRAHV